MKRSQNEIKNFFYSTIRRNIRRYNKGKFQNDKIIGPVNELLNVPEIRLILISTDRSRDSELCAKEISQEAIKFFNSMNKNNQVFNKNQLINPAFDGFWNSKLDETIEFDIDELIEKYYS